MHIDGPLTIITETPLGGTSSYHPLIRAGRVLEPIRDRRA